MSFFPSSSNISNDSVDFEADTLPQSLSESDVKEQSIASQRLCLPGVLRRRDSFVESNASPRSSCGLPHRGISFTSTATGSMTFGSFSCSPDDCWLGTENAQDEDEPASPSEATGQDELAVLADMPFHGEIASLEQRTAPLGSPFSEGSVSTVASGARAPQHRRDGFMFGLREPRRNAIRDETSYTYITGRTGTSEDVFGGNVSDASTSPDSRAASDDINSPFGSEASAWLNSPVP